MGKSEHSRYVNCSINNIIKMALFRVKHIYENTHNKKQSNKYKHTILRHSEVYNDGTYYIYKIILSTEGFISDPREVIAEMQFLKSASFMSKYLSDNDNLMECRTIYGKT